MLRCYVDWQGESFKNHMKHIFSRRPRIASSENNHWKMNNNRKSATCTSTNQRALLLLAQTDLKGSFPLFCPSPAVPSPLTRQTDYLTY